MLDGAEHAEDDCEADDVVDGMKEASGGQEKVGRPGQVDKFVDKFKTLAAQATKQQPGRSNYHKST